MLPIFILTLITFCFCALLLLIPYFFGPKDNQAFIGKKEDYECGLSPPPKSNSKISVRFFLTAILFIIFDIEIIFMYPFALAYREFLQSEHSVAILLSVGIFILIFIFGLWWEIKTKALEWK